VKLVFRIAPALLVVGLAAPLLSGCIRTEDGTLLFSERTVPARMTGVMDPARYSPRIRERRERERIVSDYPDAPRTPDHRWRPRENRIRAPQIAGVRVVSPPFKPATSSKDGLTCRNEVGQNGRVKVVCD
jgi:hypothetical protein